MRNKTYKQTLLDENVYNTLIDAKALIKIISRGNV
jgi:hypothetical protein